MQGDLRPDLTLILDAPVAIGRARAGKRSAPDRIETEHDAFFDRVRACYREMAQHYSQRICLVDATRPLAEVQSEIKQRLHEYDILN